MIKAIVFDLSGVIWTRRYFNKDFFDLLSSAVNMHPKTVRAKYKQVFTKFQLNQLELNDWLKDTFKLNQTQINRFNLDLDKLFKTHYQTHFHPKSIPLLRLLRTNQITVGCLTNSENFLVKLLDKAGLFCHFDFKITSSKVGYRKPNQKIYKKIFTIGNWKASQILFIDNQKANINTAKKLGIQVIKFISFSRLAQDLDKLIFQKD